MQHPLISIITPVLSVVNDIERNIDTVIPARNTSLSTAD